MSCLACVDGPYHLQDRMLEQGANGGFRPALLPHLAQGPDEDPRESLFLVSTFIKGEAISCTAAPPRLLSQSVLQVPPDSLLLNRFNLAAALQV